MRSEGRRSPLERSLLWILIAAPLMLSARLFMSARSLGRASVSLHRPRFLGGSSTMRLYSAKRLLANSKDSQPSELELRVYKTLVDKCGVESSDLLLLAVSGGVDSMAMLHLVAAVRATRMPDLRLRVIHFNHKRRRESEEEATFVQAVAGGYGIPCATRALLTEDSLGNGSFQLQARNWRRSESEAELALWLDAARDEGAAGRGLVCTAHHLDDQTEGFFMNVLRGAHLSNLHAMLYVSGVYIKPLLSASKSELLAYMTGRGLLWREDASNQERAYTRNRVRLDLVPLLRSLAGGERALHRRVSALAEQSNELRRFLDEAAQSYAPSSAPPSSVLHVPCPSETTLLLDDAFLSLPSLVQADILYKFVCKSTRTVPSYQFMRKLASFAQLRGKRRVIDFSSAFAVVCVGSAVRVRDNSRFERVQGELARVDLDGVAVTYPIELLEVSSAEEDASRLHLDLHNIPSGAELVLRRPMDGDLFHTSESLSLSRLVDFFRMQRVPAHLREDAIVLAFAGDNRLLAVPPFIGADYQTNTIGVQRYSRRISLRVKSLQTSVDVRALASAEETCEGDEPTVLR